jgi:hypothetical protein
MQETSGVTLIAAGVLLLIASGRACRHAGETWLTSDTFILSVVGPGIIISLATGVGTLYFASGHGESALATVMGMAFAAGIVSLAAIEWRLSRRPGSSAGRGANVLEFSGKQAAPSGPSTPDAPRPPVAPPTRRAA